MICGQKRMPQMYLCRFHTLHQNIEFSIQNVLPNFLSHFAEKKERKKDRWRK
jgi:hypothetical protein